MLEKFRGYLAAVKHSAILALAGKSTVVLNATIMPAGVLAKGEPLIADSHFCGMMLSMNKPRHGLVLHNFFDSGDRPGLNLRSRTGWILLRWGIRLIGWHGYGIQIEVHSKLPNDLSANDLPATAFPMLWGAK